MLGFFQIVPSLPPLLSLYPFVCFFSFYCLSLPLPLPCQLGCRGQSVQILHVSFFISSSALHALSTSATLIPFTKVTLLFLGELDNCGERSPARQKGDGAMINSLSNTVYTLHYSPLPLCIQGQVQLKL